MRCARRVALGLAVLGVGGCIRSGQTGSPAQGDPPRYETSGRFSPDPAGGPTGNPGEGPDLGGNRPTYYARGGEALSLLASGQLVTAVNNRGVLVYDVAEPTEPQLIASAEVRGPIYQFELDDEGAAPAVTVLALEALEFDEPRVPEQPLAQSILRLIRFDLSDPTKPERVAQVDLEGDVWMFIRRGEHHFVLSQLYQTVDLTCGQGLVGEWGPATRAMRVSDYAFDGSGFALRASLELPADWGFAYRADDAVFVSDGYYSDEDQGRGSRMSWADFSSGGLVERGPIEVEGRLAAVARGEGALVTLSEVFNPSGQTTLLQTWSLGAQNAATPRGRLVLDGEQRMLELVPGAKQLLVSGGSAVLVDLSDLANPRVVHRFPDEARLLEQVPQGLVALGPSDTGHLVASLWSLPAQGVPQQLSRFAPTWPFGHNEPDYPTYSVDREHGLLLVPSALGDRTMTPMLAVARIAADGLREYGEYALHESALRPSSDGMNAYSWSYQGLEIVPLVEGAQQATPSSGYVPFYEPKSIARLELGGRTLNLRERAEDGRYLLEVSAGPGTARTIELDHMAEGLVAVGERAVVLGFRWDSECMYMMPEPDPGSTSFDRCAPYRRRGMSVIDLAGEPAVIASFALPSSLDFEPLEGVTADTQWSGYVPLEDGRLMFLVKRYQHCSSQASCDALDVPAYESLSSPGCNPQVQNCAELPRVQMHTSGAKASVMLYTLEDVAGEPDLQLKNEIVGRFEPPGEGSSLDVSWFLLPGDRGFALAREEPIYNEEGNSVYNEHGDAIVRFYLDRVLIGADGGLRVLPSVNTPGRPVAWDGDNVYSVEPDYDRHGNVFVRARRSVLRNEGAHIEESVEIGPGFLDARAIGEQLVVLRGPADPCEENGRTDVFAIALEPGEMAKGEALDLAGTPWGFMYGPTTDTDGLVVLRGGTVGGAHLELDFTDPSPPELVRYTTAPIN